MAGRILLLYELAHPNLGNYSPTTVHVAPDAKTALTIMAHEGMDFRQEAVVHIPLPSGLVQASTKGLHVYRDALRIEAHSAGTSLLVLPVEYSHCLVFNLETPHPQALQVIRANLNQTGIIFKEALRGDLRLRFGAFVNQGCRLKDLSEAEDLKLRETVGWWPARL